MNDISRANVINWDEPVRTKKDHYLVDISTVLINDDPKYPKIGIVQTNNAGFNCEQWTEDGRYSNDMPDHRLDLENVPKKPKAVQLTDDQLRLMAGKYICHRKRLGNPVMVSSKPYPCVVVISSGQRLFTSRNLMDDFCWPPNKVTGVCDPINSEYPPTLPDYDSQHERLEVE